MDPGVAIEMKNLITQEVSNSQNIMLTQLENMMTNKLQNFNDKISENQKQLSETQVAKIEALNSDSYKFRSRGNEEQHKVNVKVAQKMKEADFALKEMDQSAKILEAEEKISEGLNILEHRQKMIKMADSSDMGWKTVAEYETSAIADNSDDERKIVRAESRATRKSKTLRNSYQNSKSNRVHPYSKPDVSARSQQQSNWRESHYAGQRQGFGYGGRKEGNRPGLCFSCGKPGHWRYECQEKGSLNKMSINNNSVKRTQSLSKDGTESTGKSVSPRGRLRQSYSKWQEIGANTVILDIIDQGYKLPFFTLPENEILKNNKSALDNKEFVSEEIQKLLGKGCITEVQQKPLVVNPLTVAEGKNKLRLVLDCRHINPHLYKYKFKYEDAKVARELFNTGDMLVSFDLMSAYHHIEIFPKHRTYLGFSVTEGSKVRYFEFNVLPFGISTAGYVFTKVLREVVSYWRAQGHKTVMFLDDGVAGASEYSKCKELSQIIQKDLYDLGFLIAEEKCSWEPTDELIWLGLVWNLTNGMVYVTQERVSKLKKKIENMLSMGNIVKVKLLASIGGQIISMQAAMGKIVLLKTREIFYCINSRASWEAPVMVSPLAKEELIFWLESVEKLNGMKLVNIFESSVTMFTDASKTGYGGYMHGNSQNGVYGQWTCSEMQESSTWRELEAVNRVLHDYEKCLEGHCVNWYTDNTNVVKIVEKGSMKPMLQKKAIDIFETCQKSNISINTVWVSRNDNVTADKLSRVSDSDDWQIKDEVFAEIQMEWGKYEVDRFASNYNAKCRKFDSKFWHPCASGVDTFNQSWKNVVNWWVPPPRLISKTIIKIENEKAKGTLLIPLWKSAPFWAKISVNKNMYKKWVKNVKIYDADIVKKGKGNNGIFGKSDSKFKMIALQIEHEFN